MFATSNSLAFFACLLLPVVAHAAPVATIRFVRENPAGNREWTLEIDPDESLFAGEPPGGSLAVELAVHVELSAVVATTLNSSVWDIATLGNNPYTTMVTEGLWSNSSGGQTTLFAAFLSQRLTAGSPVELLRIETAGQLNSKLTWGQAASGSPAQGALVAQAGTSFAGQSGLVGFMPDVNSDNSINIFDINLISSNWGTPGPAGDANLDGVVNIFDINLVSANWTPTGAGSTATAVPEPASWVLLALGAVAVFASLPRRLREPASSSSPRPVAEVVRPRIRANHLVVARAVPTGLVMAKFDLRPWTHVHGYMPLHKVSLGLCRVVGPTCRVGPWRGATLCRAKGPARQAGPTVKRSFWSKRDP